MSLVNCRSYLRARANSIGLKEWADGFNFDNIPSTLLNKSYHISPNEGTTIKNNQNDQEINYSQSIRIFVKGYRDNATAIDNAHLIVDNLIKECVNPKNRLTQSNGIKNVFFENFSFTTNDSSNDSIVMATVTFRMLFVMDVQ